VKGRVCDSVCERVCVSGRVCVSEGVRKSV
jgi:hypothetical protein